MTALDHAYTGAKFRAQVRNLQESLPFGFPTLDRSLKMLPGSITVVSAATGGGKTSFLLNVLHRLLRGDTLGSDGSVLFWSYEEANLAILTKLIMIMAGLQLASHDAATGLLASNYEGYHDEIRKGARGNPAIANALTTVDDLLDTRRLLLMDQARNVGSLVEAVREVREQLQRQEGRTLRLLMLDYVQRVPPSADARITASYQSMQHVTDRLLHDVATELQLPIVMGAQVTEIEVPVRGSRANRARTLRIRESKDIEMAASLWLHIDAEGVEPDERAITIQKNRYGPRVFAGGVKAAQLGFDGSVFTFTDPEEVASSGTSALSGLLPDDVWLEVEASALEQVDGDRPEAA